MRGKPRAKKIDFIDRSWALPLCVAIYAVVLTGIQVQRHGDFYRHSLFNLGYDFGAVIRSLYEDGRYGTVHHGIDFVAHRLPFIPLLLAGFALVFHSFEAVWLAKNLLFYGLSGWIALQLVREKRPKPLVILAVFCALFLLPMVAYTLSALDAEEAYLGHLLFASFSLLALRQTPGRIVLQGILLAAMLLTKSASLSIAGVLAILALLRCWSTGCKAWSWVPAAAVLAGIAAWGGFVQSRTGHFAWGETASSYNGLNLDKGNNPIALAMYPRQYLDDIPSDKLAPNWSTIHTEWDFNTFHQRRAEAFIASQPRDFWHLVGKRANVAFFQISRIGLQSGDEPGIDKTMLFLRPFLLAAFGLAIVRIVQRFPSRNFIPVKADFAYLICVAAYLLPFLIGFVYYRHLVPIATLTGSYLLATNPQPLLQRKTS